MKHNILKIFSLHLLTFRPEWIYLNIDEARWYKVNPLFTGARSAKSKYGSERIIFATPKQWRCVWRWLVTASQIVYRAQAVN